MSLTNTIELNYNALTIYMYIFFGEEDFFSNEKKSTKTQLIKLCTKGRVKKKQWNNTKKNRMTLMRGQPNCVLMP